MKLVKLISQKNIDNINKESNEINQIDVIDDKEYDEKYQMGRIKANEIDSSESNTDERDQIGNPQSLKRTDNQQSTEK